MAPIRRIRAWSAAPTNSLTASASLALNAAVAGRKFKRHCSASTAGTQPLTTPVCPPGFLAGGGPARVALAAAPAPSGSMPSGRGTWPGQRVSPARSVSLAAPSRLPAQPRGASLLQVGTIFSPALPAVLGRDLDRALAGHGLAVVGLTDPVDAVFDPGGSVACTDTHLPLV